MMDYNVQGMNFIHLRHAMFRYSKLRELVRAAIHDGLLFSIFVGHFALLDPDPDPQT